MKVLSIRYRFCASVDPVTYDLFDIKSARSLEAMLQTHLASGSPYIKLYIQFSSPNDAFATSTSIAVREEYTTLARNSVSELQNTEAPVFSSNISTSRASPDGAEVTLFSEPEPILTKPEDVEEGSDEEKDPRFKAYSSPTHMDNVDLSADDVLEFPDLPHRTCNHTSSLLDSGELEVGNEFSNNDSFLGVLKQHSIMNGVNYHVVKSKSDKFEAKCAVQDDTCSWKIYASLKKRIGLWKIKTYKGPYTCVGGTIFRVFE
ncbi:uncharacterized protein LOC108475171 [Gossypium arboreum]|uniref:uncharacterized protein LOC108475171 n=1 Tax=Gossypium arboreum TaxID=29729 RepID=UPI0008190598|nr:uncharacterized protein LOC108475171 [Gossypium arboreum]